MIDPIITEHNKRKQNWRKIANEIEKEIEMNAIECVYVL